jgi:hypothetical protein
VEIGPAAIGHLLVNRLTSRREDNNRGSSSARIAPKPATYLIAIHFGHHNVYDDDLGLSINRFFQALTT